MQIHVLFRKSWVKALSVETAGGDMYFRAGPNYKPVTTVDHIPIELLASRHDRKLKYVEQIFHSCLCITFEWAIPGEIKQ